MSRYEHSPRVRRTLAALARITCPPEIEELDLVDDVVDHMGLSMGSLPELFCRGLVVGLTTYELGARLVPGNGGRAASQLDPDRALRYFQLWRKSPLMPQRELIKAVRGLLCMAFYEQPAAREQIGYTPEQWIDKVKRKRLAVYADEINAHQRSLIEPDPLPLDELFPKGDAAAASSETKEAV